MDKFDEAFDNQPFPKILLNMGWSSMGKMKYMLGDTEIWFDTSTSIQVTKDRKSFVGYDPRTEEHFKEIVAKLGITHHSDRKGLHR